MSRRRIGQEAFGFAVDGSVSSSLDDLAGLIEWVAVDQALCVISGCRRGRRHGRRCGRRAVFRRRRRPDEGQGLVVHDAPGPLLPGDLARRPSP